MKFKAKGKNKFTKDCILGMSDYFLSENLLFLCTIVESLLQV